MNQPDQITPTSQPVSTVTKHIKIYSDNPIHDCIDRIITAVNCLDEANDFYPWANNELCEAADNLTELAFNYRKQKADEFRRSISERRPN
jgi:hypothetical protein